MRTLLVLLATAAGLLAQGEYVTLQEWRTLTGDDPRFADPAFDDSSWKPTPFSAGSGELRWLRARVQVPAWWAGQPLAIAIHSLPAAYQVFVDGREVGRSGTLPPEQVREFATAHIAFPVTVGPTVTLAVRLVAPREHVPPRTPGFLSPPVLGLRTTIGQLEQLHTTNRWVEDGILRAVWFLIGLCGIFCLWLYRERPEEVELLWLGLALACNGGARLTVLPVTLAWIPSNSALAFFLFWTPFLGVHFFYCWLLAELLPRWRNAIRVASLPIAFLSVIQGFQPFLSSVVPGACSDDLRTAGFFIQGALAVLAVVTNLQQRRFDFAALGAAILIRIAYANSRTASAYGNFVVAFSMVVILYLRFRRQQRLRAEAERDLEAASRVQMALLGTGAPQSPGFAVETAYYPARQVGGDFYYFAPAANGAMLLVIGDVSGKGLQAAMLVASLIGSLRNEDSQSPAVILSRLNRSLRTQDTPGFVTCCCARFDPGGSITLANAGHLSPYCDGRELALEAALPLGVAEDAGYTEATVTGARLLFLSDGVIEAANSKGELFGFERAAAMSLKPAEEIAAAARAWGQNDDITVVAVSKKYAAS